MENHLDEKLIFREDGIQARQSLAKMAKYDFYQNENWFEEMCEILFKIKRRKSSIKSEIYYGLIHFISCLYVLAVVPQQLEPAGYRYTSTICAVAACSGAGSIVCGLFANLPFVLAPPTVVSIFLSVFLLQYGYGTKTGNISVIISGFLLMLFGWRPLGNLFARLVPMPIQAGTAIGIGLLTALAGSTEIGLVVQGKYNVLKMGELTSEVIIAIFGVLLVCIAMIYHVKGSFCLAVIVCSLLWWTTENAFPTSIASAPHADLANLQDIHWTNVPLLTADLIFLYFLYLNGLVPTLAQQADLTREDNSIPRGRWLFIMAGFFTILGGLFCSAPVLISPESSGGIKAGAKTGLSTVVAGILFLISLFFSPILEKIPSAATGPLLIVIGILLFNNVSRINWRSIKEAAPAFIVLFYIPFTYSIIQGVALGYTVYIIIYTATGDIFDHIFDFLVEYFPSKEEEVEDIREYYYGLCLRLRRFLGYDEHRSSSDKQESMHVSSGNRSSKDSQSNLSERQEISTNVEEGKADISEASNIRPLSRKASVSRLEKSRSQSYAVDFDLSFRNEDDDGSTANPITTPYVDFTFEQDPTRPQDDAVSRPSSKD